MSVSSTTNKVIYTGSGTTGPFDFDFKIYASSDLVVEKYTISTEAIATLTETTDYIVTIDVNGTGYVTTVAAVTSAYKLIIRRVLPITQAIDYVDGDKFPAETHEEGLDRSRMIDQQLQEQIDRCVKVPASETTAPSYEALIGIAETARDESVAASLVSVAASTEAQNYASAIQSTSTSSNEITVAEKTFTTQEDKQYSAGMFVVVIDSANNDNYMYGQVVSYTGTTLVVDVQAVGGTGVKTSWNIFISGMRGAVGATGAPGPAGEGSGDVLGPATNTDSFLPQWDGANSKTLKNGIQVGNGANMIPQLDGDSFLDAGIIPTIAIDGGGTGATTAQTAINALTGVASATNEYVLTKDTATGDAKFKAIPVQSTAGFEYISSADFSDKGSDSPLTVSITPELGYLYKLLVEYSAFTSSSAGANTITFTMGGVSSTVIAQYFDGRTSSNGKTGNIEINFSKRASQTIWRFESASNTTSSTISASSGASGTGNEVTSFTLSTGASGRFITGRYFLMRTKQ